MDLTSNDIELLVQKCQTESPFGTSAFKELVLLFQPSIHRFCFNYIKNDNDAEELTQNIFIKVFHNIKNFKGESKFKTWLYRIAINQCADLYNKKKKQAKIKQDMFAQRGEIGIKDNHENSLALTDNIDKCLNQMPQDQKEILILRFFEGLKVKEISETLDISLSAAKMRLSRAVEHFKILYDDS